MPTTYEPIATTTLGSDTANVTFSTISGSYTDLILVLSAKGSVNDRSVLLQFNSDTGSNYSATYVFGSGSSASSGRYTIMNIQNYSNSTTYKTLVGRESVASIGVDAVVGLWRSTNAITTIKLLLNEGNFKSGSTFTLYGIKAA
jgi:hypothetical protein